MKIDLDKHCVSIAAILGLVVIESVALCNGIDGIALSATFAAIGAIAGFKFGISKK